MNDELRAAFDLLDDALAEARAALEKPEPEPPCVALRMQNGCDVYADTVTLIKQWHDRNGDGTWVDYRFRGETMAVVSTDSPAAIRALCAAAGVPCPEEEKRVVGSVAMTLTRLLRIGIQTPWSWSEPVKHGAIGVAAGVTNSV